MNKKYIYFVFTLFLLSFIKLSAQQTEAEYLKIEEKRIEQAQKIEIEIEEFIKSNLNSYILTDELIESVKNSKNCKDNQAFIKTSLQTLSKEELEDILTNLKKQELRKLYFEENKDKETYFHATESNRTISCTNGGFEDGVAGYTFQTMNSQANWNGINTVMNGNAVAINNATLNQFANNTYATLVSPGNDPFLAGSNIFVPRVLNGNRAIKLNPTEPANNNDRDITTMTRNIFIDDDFLDINFSLIMNNPGHNGPNFFRVRVLDPNNNNEIIDQIYIDSDPDNCLYNNALINNQDILYTGWVCARLNVGEIINQQATIEFMIADCSQSAHFSTVYIDDICGATSSCDNPAFGSINLNPLNQTCPSFPLSICGTYLLPPNSTLGGLSLDVIDNSGNSSTINVTPQLNGNTFCFQVNANDFPSLSGQYEFTVNATFDVNCPTNVFEYNTSDTSTDLGPDIDFDYFETISNIEYNILNNDTVSWDNTSSNGYIIEFVADGECCSIGSSYTLNPTYYTVTTNNNFFNSLDIHDVLSAKCFRWRAKPNKPCGKWSEWCCISVTMNPSGNPYEENDICHPNPPCDGEYSLTISSPVLAGITSIENVDGYITAYNIINNNANAEYYAGDYISLTNNFHAKLGSNFLARIQPCLLANTNKENSSNKESKLAITESTEKNINLIKINKDEHTPIDFIKVYPNPATNEVNISTNDTSLVGVDLIDGTGKLLQTNTNINSKEIKLNVETFSPGIYFLRINTQNSGTYIEKIIIQ